MIAMPPPPPVNGYLYAQTNDIRPGRNEVVPYAIGRRGQLTPVPGGRVRTGGTGISDQTPGKSQAENADPSIAATADGRFLYAVNGGSDTVAGFRVQGNGTLTPLPGSPYPSRGVNPVSVSIGADGHTVIVGNRNEDPLRLALLRGAARPTVVAFRINDDGALRPTGAAVYTAGGLPVEGRCSFLAAWVCREMPCSQSWFRSTAVPSGGAGAWRLSGPCSSVALAGGMQGFL